MAKMCVHYSEVPLYGNKVYSGISEQGTLTEVVEVK